MCFFFFNDPAPPEISPLPPPAPLPTPAPPRAVLDLLSRHKVEIVGLLRSTDDDWTVEDWRRSEEHTSELQSRQYLVCRLLLEKKNKKLTLKHQEHIHVAHSIHVDVSTR